MKSCLMKFCRLVLLALTLPLNVMEITGLCGAYKRFFPFLAYNVTFSYNAKMHRIKRDLFRDVGRFANTDGSLRLLEIGCGSGANFSFYPCGCTVTCTDPNPHFHRYLQLSMDANQHLTYDAFIVARGEDMKEVQDESVDVVVCTLVLCSVSNVQQVLQEIRRILRTGGAFFFWSMSSQTRPLGHSSFSMCLNLCGTTLGMDAELQEQHGKISKLQDSPNFT